jgi:predicted regulator of Ras-like GTPase activity (Roadblock/LC7/MglB family)
VEFNRALHEIRKAADALAGGALIETVVVLSRFSVVFRSLDEDLYLAVVVAPDGNLGKARYLIRRNLVAIRAEL